MMVKANSLVRRYSSSNKLFDLIYNESGVDDDG